MLTEKEKNLIIPALYNEKNWLEESGYEKEAKQYDLLIEKVKEL